MGEWLGLIGALAGAAITGIITYFTAGQQYRNARQQEIDQRLIASFEEIHQLLTSVASLAATLNMRVIGDLGYNTPFKAESIKETAQLERLRMLVNFYAPTLNPDIEAVTEKYAVIIRAMSEVILKTDRNNDWKKRTLEASAVASIDLTKLAVEGQKKLAALVRPIVNS